MSETKEEPCTHRYPDGRSATANNAACGNDECCGPNYDICNLCEADNYSSPREGELPLPEPEPEY